MPFHPVDGAEDIMFAGCPSILSMRVLVNGGILHRVCSLVRRGLRSVFFSCCLLSCRFIEYTSAVCAESMAG